MLEHIISEIKLAGAKAMQLNVNRYNKSVHFYEKQGFTIIRQEDIDIGSGYFMNDFVMELPLSK
jgi:ribosomal protein S18 acetylase RimI-like enzyme